MTTVLGGGGRGGHWTVAPRAVWGGPSSCRKDQRTACRRARSVLRGREARPHRRPPPGQVLPFSVSQLMCGVGAGLVWHWGGEVVHIRGSQSHIPRCPVPLASNSGIPAFAAPGGLPAPRPPFASVPTLPPGALSLSCHSYDWSVVGWPANHPNRAAALAWLRARNPNANLNIPPTRPTPWGDLWASSDELILYGGQTPPWGVQTPCSLQTLKKKFPRRFVMGMTVFMHLFSN